MNSIMNFLKVFSGDSEQNFLEQPGDEASLRVTKNGIKVAKLHTGDGSNKYYGVKFLSVE